jgi:hypothetical protein
MKSCWQLESVLKNFKKKNLGRTQPFNLGSSDDNFTVKIMTGRRCTQLHTIIATKKKNRMILNNHISRSKAHDECYYILLCRPI